MLHIYLNSFFLCLNCTVIDDILHLSANLVDISEFTLILFNIFSISLYLFHKIHKIIVHLFVDIIKQFLYIFK
jgi:hypothetical protein